MLDWHFCFRCIVWCLTHTYTHQLSWPSVDIQEVKKGKSDSWHTCTVNPFDRQCEGIRGSSTVGMLHKANMTKPHLSGLSRSSSFFFFLVTFTLLWISCFLFSPPSILQHTWHFSFFFFSLPLILYLKHPCFSFSFLPATPFISIFLSFCVFTFASVPPSSFQLSFCFSFLPLCVCCCQSTAVCLGPWGDTVQVFLIWSQGKDASDSDWCVIPVRTNTHT